MVTAGLLRSPPSCGALTMSTGTAQSSACGGSAVPGTSSRRRRRLMTSSGTAFRDAVTWSRMSACHKLLRLNSTSTLTSSASTVASSAQSRSGRRRCVGRVSRGSLRQKKKNRNEIEDFAKSATLFLLLYYVLLGDGLRFNVRATFVAGKPKKIENLQNFEVVRFTSLKIKYEASRWSIK